MRTVPSRRCYVTSDFRPNFNSSAVVIATGNAGFMPRVFVYTRPFSASVEEYLGRKEVLGDYEFHGMNISTLNKIVDSNLSRKNSFEMIKCVEIKSELLTVRQFDIDDAQMICNVLRKVYDKHSEYQKK